MYNKEAQPKQAKKFSEKLNGI